MTAIFATEAEAGNWPIDNKERLCVVKKGGVLRDQDCIGVTVRGDTVNSAPDHALVDATITLVKGNPYGL